MQVKGANGGLYSPTRSRTITTSGGPVQITSNNEGFGLCISAVSANAGTLNKSSAFAGNGGTCSTNYVGGVTTAYQNLADTGSQPIDGNGFQSVDAVVKAAVGSSTPAAGDYGETLTFISTATY